MMPQTADCVLAFDIGGSATKLALVSDTGTMSAWRSFATHASDRTTYLDRLTASLRELAADTPETPLGIAGAIAGFLDEAMNLAYNPTLAWLEGADIHGALSSAFHLPVLIENDANAASAGEYLFGSGQGSHRFLCLTGGTGLGVGMVVNGEIVRAACGGLGDAGHIIVEPAGPACSCGGRGCAEAVLSTQFLAKRYSERQSSPQTFRNLVSAATAGEPLAQGLLEQAGRQLGIAAASLAHIFFPDRIAIAGGLSEAGAPLLSAAVSSFALHGGTYPVSLATIVRATTGAHAPLLGAAASFFQQQKSSTHRHVPVNP